MTLIKLKKLISRGDILKLIEDTLKALQIDIAIEEDSEVIYGSRDSSNSLIKFEVKVGDSIIGYVCGDEKAAVVAGLLSYAAANEFDKKKLAEETLNRYREINILYNVTEKIAVTGGINNVAKHIIYEAMKHVESTRGCIMLVKEATGGFEIVAENHKNLNINTIGKLNKSLISHDAILVRQVMEKKTSQMVNNLSESEAYSGDSEVLGSIICVPVLSNNRVLGLMVVGHEEPIEYKSEDLKLCSALGILAGSAIENAKLYDNLRETFFDTVQTLVDIIEMRDFYGNGHTRRVVNYSLNIAKALKMPRVDQVKLKLAAMLHDIGQIAISDEVFGKKGKVSEEELANIRTHAVRGAEMLNRIDKLKDVIPVIRAHHERYDGSGYPDRLVGEQIPLMARIIAVADAFEAMTNDRPYREAINLYFAAEELKRCSGTQFDPKIVETFFEIYKDKKLEEIQNYVYEV